MIKIFATILLITLLSIGCYSSKQFVQLAEEKQPYVFPFPISDFNKRLPLKSEPMMPLVSIVAVGDIMLGNHTIYYLEKYGVDYPFDSTRNFLSRAQIAFGNLESPFTRGGSQFDKRFTFKVQPEYAISLVNAGFDVVTLANNHILDYGIEGLESTLSVLDSIGIAYCGAGLNFDHARKPAILEREGFKIAFLGYSMTFPQEFWASSSTGGTNYPYRLAEDIECSDSLSNLVVVTFHWGGEGLNYPKDYQKVFAHLAIDAGADLVLGHHPHVLQGLEIYKNRLIAYSLGNFSFSSYSRKAKESMMLRVNLTEDGLLFAKIIPISVNNYYTAFQPRPLYGTAADSVFANLKKYSDPLNSKNIIDGKGYIWGGRFVEDDSLLAQKQRQLIPGSSN